MTVYDLRETAKVEPSTLLCRAFISYARMFCKPGNFLVIEPSGNLERVGQCDSHEARQMNCYKKCGKMTVKYECS